MSGQATWRDDGRCLVCGPENEHGLHLRFMPAPQGASAEGVVPDHLQGFARRSHGGIVCAILDEAMYYAVAMQGMPGVATGEISVRYRRPLPTGEPFRVDAQCLRVTRRFAKTEATLRCGGEIVAQASGTFLPVPSDMEIKGD